MRSRLLTLVLTLAALPAAESALSEPVPLEDFFRNPAFYDVQISRDGRFVSTITRTDSLPESRNIIVMEIGKWNEPRLVTGYKEEEIRWHTWLHDGRLVFKVDRAYEDPNKSSEYVGLYTVRHDGKQGRALHEPFRRDSRRGRGTSTANMATMTGGARETIRMIDDMAYDPDRVLVAVSEGPTRFRDVARMDLRNGSLEHAGNASDRYYGWFADNEGRVRVALDQGENRDDLDRQLVYRPTEDDEWRPIFGFRSWDVQVFGFDADNRHFWLSSAVDRDKAALFRLDLETGEMGEPVVADPTYDVMTHGAGMRGLVRDNDGTALAFEYMADKPRLIALDDGWRERQQAIDAVLPETINQVIDWSDDHTRVVIRTRSDRDPGGYYLLDMEAGSLRHIVSRRPWIDPARMSAMQPVSFEARDGLTIHGYLTLPAPGSGGDCAPDCRSPLIVHPHGGPFNIRDNWRFNDDVQFLASRGYAVLQVNYRGSGGYGRKFLTAGFKRWGLEMQDDLTDAVQWAIEEGVADPRRVAIYGASYGGYATMMGLVKNPELYRVGINYVGVVDLKALYRNDTRKDLGYLPGMPELSDNWWREHIGHPRTDADRFHETSPINFVERIEAPLLVVHGRRDWRVDYDYQYQPLVRALRRHDKVHETLTKRHEGHGFYREQNQIELYERIERFLAQHMPAEPTSAEQLADR